MTARFEVHVNVKGSQHLPSSLEVTASTYLLISKRPLSPN